MEINHKLEAVAGSFNTVNGRLKCVTNPKYAEVLLCFDSGMNIPFAKIELHSRNRYMEGMAVLDDAAALGEEIVSRWNKCAANEAGEGDAPAGSAGELDALQASLQECATLLGLSAGSAPAEVVETLRQQLTTAGAMTALPESKD